MAISLQNIVSGQRLKPPKIALYGVGGIGKTKFASEAPNPIFLFTEEGQGRMDVARFELRDEDPILRSWEEILECLSWLYSNPHDRMTVVIDTLDFAEPLLWDYTCRKHKKEDIEAFGYGKGYVHACDEARVLLQWLDALRTDKKMAVILLAHADTKKFDAPDHEPYDRYKLRLQDKFANLIHDWSDALLFAKWEEHIVRDKDSFDKNKSTARGVGQGKRLVFTEERPAWWAKNRYNLPFQMNLSWPELQDAIVAGMNGPIQTPEIPEPQQTEATEQPPAEEQQPAAQPPKRPRKGAAAAAKETT